MSARIFVFTVVIALGFLGSGIAADESSSDFAPKVSDIQAYAPIWKRSPFIVETVAVQVSAGLSAKYSLVGIASMAGQPIIFLVDKNNGDPAKNRLLVSKAQPSKDGVELVSVSMENDPRKSSAVIRQGGQQATLPFDTAALPPTGPNSQPGAIPPAPGAVVPALQAPAALPGALSNPGATPPPSPRRIIRPSPINLSN